MPEPIDPPIATPLGGWPRVTVRLHLDASVKHARDAAYELACYTRRHRIGCVTTWEGADVYAYPHQTAAQIEHSWLRMRQMERAGLAQALKPSIERWTVQRKAGLVFAVAEGFLARADALSAYQISEEEFASWEARHRAYGDDGLAAGKVQALATPERAVA